MSKFRLLALYTKSKVRGSFLLWLFIFFNSSAIAQQNNTPSLNFNVASFSFQYNEHPVEQIISGKTSLKSEQQLPVNTSRLIQQITALNTAKSYFELTYAYVKHYGRAFTEKLIVESSGNQMVIKSSAPLRTITVGNTTLPLHYFLKIKSSGQKNGAATFHYTMPDNSFAGFCSVKQNCRVVLTDISGKKHNQNYILQHEEHALVPLGLGFYGLPCQQPACTEVNSKSLSYLASQLPINVVDVSNQQLIFNEQILCESAVIKNCENGLVKQSNKNTLEWHVMENQLVIQLQEISQQQRFFQAEVFVAWINPMMKETRAVSTVFARHKNKKQLIELLANKVAVLSQVMLAANN